MPAINRNVYYFLIGIILTTIPCYCLGGVALTSLTTDDETVPPTPTTVVPSPISTVEPTLFILTIEAGNTLLPTSTPQATATPSATLEPTPTQFFPTVVSTATSTNTPLPPTPTHTAIRTSTPVPTATSTPAEDNDGDDFDFFDPIEITDDDDDGFDFDSFDPLQ